MADATAKTVTGSRRSLKRRQSRQKPAREAGLQQQGQPPGVIEVPMGDQHGVKAGGIELRRHDILRVGIRLTLEHPEVH